MTKLISLIEIRLGRKTNWYNDGIIKKKIIV